MRKQGVVPGVFDKHGYTHIMFKAKDYLAHRLAWLLTYGKWPDNDIDHIDGNPGNNRLVNLRYVTHQENMHNQQKPRISSTSGFLGVSWYKTTQKWLACIRLDSKAKHIGYYDTAEEASVAYEQAKLVYHPSAPIVLKKDKK